MNGCARRIVWFPLLLLLLVVPAVPAQAQFEEPDSVPRFSIGATGELVFRGGRGNSIGQTVNKISFGGGPPVGLRVEYRLTGTLAGGIAGSWARLNEKIEGESSSRTSMEGFNQFQFSGELLFKVKPNIPGYFILGGGARYIKPDSDDPAAYFHNNEAFTEPMGILGAGVELGARSSRVFKLDVRLYFVSPAEQTDIDTKSLVVDLAFGLGLMFRL